MPILAPNAPQIVTVPAKFQSALPSSFADDAAAAPLFRALTASTFGQKHIENGMVLAGHLGKSLATTIGWEGDELGTLEDLTNTVMSSLSKPQLEAIAVMFDALRPTIGAALQPVVEIVSEAVTGVPIIGWIARLGFATWKNVKRALEAKPMTKNVALGYNRDNDEDVTQLILDRIGDDDWSPIFAPPAGDFHWAVVAYTSSGEADGVSWGQLASGQPGSDSLAGIDTYDDALGMLPGVGDIAGYWQTPRYIKGDKGKWAVREQIVSQGQLGPSATSLAGQLWANMQRPGPQLGRVDLIALRDMWQDYGQKLISFAGTAGGKSKSGRGEWLTEQIVRAWSWHYKGTNYYDVSPSSVPKVFRQGHRLDDLISYKIDIAWKNAVQSMQTHAAAYMTSSAPLLVNDAGLRELLAKQQNALVHGAPGVDAVDLSLVPDTDLRAAIAVRQQQQQGGKQPQRTPTPKRKPDLPSLGSSGGGGAIMLGVALVLAAGAYAATRRSR